MGSPSAGLSLGGNLDGMTKAKLKRQKWFQFLFKVPLRWRHQWLDRQSRQQLSIFRKVILGGNIIIRPSNLMSRFEVQANSDIAQSVLMYGDYEPELLEIFKTVWKGPGAVVNVGANVGFWAIGIVNVVEGVEKVYAIEPNPEAFDLLVRNIALNGMNGRVTPIHACVAEREGEVDLEIVPGKPEYSSIGGVVHPAVSGLQRNVIPIIAQPLDRIVHVKAGSVKLLLIDTEGADYLVLRGAGAFLEQHKPIIVFECCESLLNKFGHSVRMLRSMLGELGYETRRVMNPGEPVPDGLDGEQGLAFPAESASDIIPRLKTKT